MTYEQEHEWKYLLTEEQFQQLMNDFELTNQHPLIQTNTYYDTKSQHLKQLDAALRLRNFEDSSVWTLKQRVDTITSHEWHQPNLQPIQPAPESQLDRWIEQSMIKDFFRKHDLHLKDLQPTVELTTKRWVKPVEYGELVLDCSQYYGVVDYELEFEANQIGLQLTDNHVLNAESWLQSLIKHYHLTTTSAPTKLKRAIDQSQIVGK